MMQAVHKKRITILPLLVFVGLMMLVTFFWQQTVFTQAQDLQEQVELTGRLVSQEFLSIVKSDIAPLENLKNGIEITDGEYFDYWEYDADLILSQNKSFKFIEWIDSSMVIRKINPHVGNEGALNLDISKVSYRKEDWLKHAKERKINFTPWAPMTQGGHAFLVDIPVYFKGAFQGTITAGMNFTDNFSKFAAGVGDFAIKLEDEMGTVFYQHELGEDSSLSSGLSFVNDLHVDSLDQKSWKLTIVPPQRASFFKSDPLPFYIFVFGIILSFLISALIYFFLKTHYINSAVIETNKELSELNIKLSKERNRAQKASRAKTDFLSNMSHEIRTPLNAILGFIQVLKDAEMKPKDREYLELMDESSKNLLSLVNDIIEIDLIESGKIKLNLHPFNPFFKVEGLVQLFRPSFQEKGLYFNFEFERSMSGRVVGDEGKFTQVVANILKNALKFTDAGGVTILYTEKVIDNKLDVDVMVKDTGIGIPKSKLQSIFSRFTQLESSTKKKHEGSGLGLAISEQLITIMGGSIAVNSAVNEGSEFKVFIPFQIASTSDVELQREKKKSLPSLSLSHLKALIVDDNRINMMVLSKLLEPSGIVPDMVENGREAVEKVRNGSYDLVMMDIHMPLMNGYEATNIIRMSNKDVIIVGFSANVTREAIDKALFVGMNDYITKPFTKERLYELLTKFFVSESIKLPEK